MGLASEVQVNHIEEFSIVQYQVRPTCDALLTYLKPVTIKFGYVMPMIVFISVYCISWWAELVRLIGWATQARWAELVLLVGFK